MFIYKKAFITSLIISLLTGFLTGIFILQNHPFTKQCATSIICKLMCKSYNCDFKAEVAFINIFSCSLICKNVTVAPLAPEKEEKYWAWNAEQLNFSFSLIDLLTIKKLLLNLRITHANIETMIDEKNIAIADHIQKLLFSKNFKFPTAINILKMQNVKLRLYNKEHHIDTLLTWSGTSKKINNQVKSMFYFDHGLITHNQQIVLTNFKGSIYSNLARNGTNTILLDAYAALSKNNKACFINGELHGEIGSLFIRSQDKKCSFKTTINNNTVKTTGLINSSILQDLGIIQNCILSDQLTINNTLNLSDKTCIGSLENRLLPLKWSWFYQNNELTFNGQLTNKLNILSTAWSLNKDCIFVTGTYRPNYTSITCNIPLTNQVLEKNCTISGTTILNKNTIQAHGTAGSYQWNIEGTISPFTLFKGLIHKADGAQLIDLSNLESQTFTCTLQYQELQHLIPEYIRQYIDGNASFLIKGHITQNKLYCSISLQQGTLGCSYVPNILTNLTASAEFDYKNKKITLSDLEAQFHQGTLYVSKAQLLFDQTGHINFIHLPISFKQLLGGLGKNFAIGTGNLTYQFNQTSSLDGNILLEKTYFSDIPLDLQIKSWSPKPIKYNINLETKEPIRIRSKTINASLVTQLNLQYHTHPLINGQISVKSGTIKLPYSKLKIISGTLHFAAEQQLDPLLELTAKTFLQNYTITIHVTGSLKKPIINLSSVPALPEEKIAALVLTGSQQISFNIIAPGLIVEFFKKQLLEHSKQIIKKPKLNTLLKPLKHIKFTPTFTDESGRQGLYGGVEVDLGHRLHARVQKNLNLEEDTEFEINYQISDECNLQAFKNEHGNIGAQLEMHLKL